MRLKFLLTFNFFISINVCLLAQINIEWIQNYGGSGSDTPMTIDVLEDGNYMICGYTGSINNDFNSNYGGSDMFAMKMDVNFNVIWTKNYGGSQNDFLNSFVELQDGFYIAGYSRSDNNDITIPFGNNDYIVIRCDLEGNVMWSKNYGDFNEESLSDLIIDEDDLFLVGSTNSNVSSDYNAQVIKVNSAGEEEWSREFGGVNSDSFRKGVRVGDELMFFGQSESSTGDVNQNYGDRDIWVVKTDLSGDVTWSMNYGGSDVDYMEDVVDVGDGFIIGASSASNDIDVNSNYGNNDIWLFKIDYSGAIIWSKNYGGSGDDRLNGITFSSNGIFVSGYSDSNDFDLISNYGGDDMFVFEVDGQGNLIWTKSIGGSNIDQAMKVINTESDVLVLGKSSSSDLDIGNNYGSFDIFLANLELCSHPDYKPLMSFYSSTNGDQWTNTLNNNQPWAQSCNPCDGSWYGIGCENDRVTSIVLEYNNLTGEIQALEFDLLEIFDCAENNIGGEMPSFDQVPKLEKFLCFDNNIGGEIFSFDSIPNLQEFSCSFNNIGGEMPSFDEVPNLTIFHCSFNNIGGEIHSFDQIPNLQKFSCSNNDIGGEMPSFDQVSNLQKFNCSNNEIRGEMPSFDQVPNLLSFNCYNNEIGGELPSLLDVPSLRVFYINDNLIQGCLDSIGFLCESLIYNEDYDSFIINSSEDTIWHYTTDGYNIDRNPFLPWQGDLTQYCLGLDSPSEQEGAPCDLDGDPNTLDQITNCQCVSLTQDTIFLSYNDAQGVVGDTLDFYLSVDGFEEIIGFGFATFWDTIQLEFADIDLLNQGLPNFNTNSIAVFDDLVAFSWDDGGNNYTLDDGSFLYRLRLKVISDRCENSVISIIPTFNGTLEFANSDFIAIDYNLDFGSANIVNDSTVDLDYEDGDNIELCLNDPLELNLSTISDSKVYIECETCILSADSTDLGGGVVTVFFDQPGVWPITFYTDSESCGQGQSIVINVIAIEGPQLEATLNTQGGYCQGQELTVSIIDLGFGSQFSFQILDPFGATVADGGGVSNIDSQFSPTISGQYSIQSFNDLGCEGETVFFDLIESPVLEEPSIQCSNGLNSITFSWNDVGATYAVLITSGQSSGSLNSTTFTVDNLIDGEEVSIDLIVADPNGICDNILVTDSCTYQSTCPENPLAYPSCDLAFSNPVCNLNDLTAYCSRMPALNQNGPSPFCSGIGITDNISWFSFIAGNGNYSIKILESDCINQQGFDQGIQVAILESMDGCDISNEVYCSGVYMDGQTFEISSDVLISGVQYFLLIDGWVGSVCNYEIEISGDHSPFQYEINGLCVTSPISSCDNESVVNLGDVISIIPDELPTLSFPVQDEILWTILTPSGIQLNVVTNENLLTQELNELGIYNICINSGIQGCIESNWAYCIDIEVVDNTCDHPDLPALISLYNSTNGASWFNNTGWKEGAEGTNCDPCNGSWFGIECENGRVVCVDLDGVANCSTIGNTGNNLAGNLMDYNLEKLKFFSVSRNQLEGNLPNFSGMPELESFYCSYNKLEGDIPNFSELPLLSNFSCHDNDLSGVIPDFESLSFLSNLDCSFNNLEGRIPEFSDLSNLENIYCSNNILSGEIPLFATHTKLVSLLCDHNMLSGAIPDLSNLPNLRVLSVESNSLTSCYPDYICSLEYFSAINNLLLPWKGDIQPFCNGESQNGAPCLLDSVEGEIDANCECTLKEECTYDLLDDEVIINVSDAISVDVFENDELPITYTSSITNNSHPDLLSEYTFEDGLFEFVITDDFSEVISVTYEVCDADCVDCFSAQLNISNEAIQHIIQTNIISPNNDGANDVLRFTEAAVVENSELFVYNRWGDRIFQMKNYDNSWTAEGYPGGIYFYVLRVNGVDIKRTLTVVK